VYIAKDKFMKKAFNDLYEEIILEKKKDTSHVDKSEHTKKGVSTKGSFFSLKDYSESTIKQMMHEIDSYFLEKSSQLVGLDFEDFLIQYFKGNGKDFKQTNVIGEKSRAMSSPFADVKCGSQIYSVKYMNAEFTKNATWSGILTNNFGVDVAWLTNAIIFGNYNVSDKTKAAQDLRRQIEEMSSWGEYDEFVRQHPNLLNDNQTKFGIIWGRAFKNEETQPVLQLYHTHPVSARHIYDKMHQLFPGVDNSFFRSKTKFKAKSKFNIMFDAEFPTQDNITIVGQAEHSTVKDIKKDIKQELLNKHFDSIDDLADKDLDILLRYVPKGDLKIT
jgi:hypothetical protein